MRKSWKKQWIEELDERVPALREDVLNAPIPTASVEQNEAKENIKTPIEMAVEKDGKKAKKASKGAWMYKIANWLERVTAYLKSRRRMVLRIAATAVASLVVCMVAIYAFLPGVEPSNVGAFALEINPRAVFTVDERGIVTAVIAGNEDADVILSGEKRKKELEGKPIEDAMEIFVDYAAKLGYLNLESGDIIRVSACNEGENSAAIGNRLTSYFCNKGVYVAVLAERVSVQDFCTRIGNISASTVNNVVQTFESLPVLYTEREASGKSVTELQTIYQTKVPQEEVKTTVEELLNHIMDWIEKREASLQEISDMNTLIKNHEENPAFLFKDYWSVQNFHDESSFTLRFALLMQSMQTLVAEHENTYGVKMESEIDLKALQLEASSEYLQYLAELLTDFTMEAFNGSTEFLSMVLGWVGVDVDLANLCEEPKNVKEYLEKTQKYNEIRYSSLRTEGFAAYETERQPLTEEEYNAYIQSVCAEYGSLEVYWAAVNG